MLYKQQDYAQKIDRKTSRGSLKKHAFRTKDDTLAWCRKVAVRYLHGYVLEKACMIQHVELELNLRVRVDFLSQAFTIDWAIKALI